MTDALVISSPPSAPAAPQHPVFAAARTPPPLHGDVGVRRFFIMNASATIFPLVAGIVLFGWRAAVTVALVVAGAGIGLMVWRRIGLRGSRVSTARGIWMALLLALALPAHLASYSYPEAPTSGWIWPMLPAAGLALAFLLWLFAGLGSGRVHPVPVIYLLIVICFQNMLIPHFVLHRQHIVTGNLIDAAPPQRLSPGETAPVRKEPWTAFTLGAARDAVYLSPASERLVTFTTGRQTPARAALSLEELLRDYMPPLEDLIVGGQPTPIGVGSAVAVIMGGLFMLRRGLIDFRVPLLIFIAAILALITLPIPVAVRENTQYWQSLALHKGVGWEVATTFVSYELMAGPLLFVAFYLASAPGVRPLTRRGRTVYALLLGVIAAALQLYLDVSYGAYLALLIAGLFTPLFDRVFKPRPLV